MVSGSPDAVRTVTGSNAGKQAAAAEEPYVVGETAFATLAEALEAVTEEKAEIVLQADAEETEKVNIEKTVTICLNGHNISLASGKNINNRLGCCGYNTGRWAARDGWQSCRQYYRICLNGPDSRKLYCRRSADCTWQFDSHR